MARSRRYSRSLNFSRFSTMFPSFIMVFLLFSSKSNAWDQTDLELFDLVEEVQQNFYQVLEIDQSASPSDIRRAYRKLSLQLHPDKNKEDNAEEKFRQLVAVAEVLKDEDKRKRYDGILEHGLPDWKQPVFYYRRVRKMGLLELSLLLSAILSVGHYLVIWSMYFERKLELEALIKPKREKKGKKGNKQQTSSQPTTEELTQSLLQDPNLIQKPHLTDVLPWKMACLMFSIISSLPDVYRSTLENWRARRKVEVELDEEDEEGEESSRRKEQGPREKQRMDPAMYDYDRSASASVMMKTGVEATNVNGSVAMNSDKNKALTKFEWSASEVSILVKAMSKYPGGTTDRWNKIAEEVKKPVDMVMKKVKQLKSQKFASNVDASAQGITGGIQHTLASKKGGLAMSDDNITKSTNEMEPYEYSSEDGLSRSKKPKPAKTKDRTLMIASEAQSGNIQNDASMSSKDTQHREVDELVHSGVESCAWTQRQQKILEKALQVYPKGVDDRWDKIADSVPGKTKEECIIRFKELVEVVKRKKQSAASQR